MQKTFQTSIQETLKTIQQKIQQILSQQTTKSKNVTLVGVSKTKPVELLQEAYDAGLRHFGENYVDEIQQKHSLLPQDIKWHFIGHLQSNKIKQVCVPNLYVIETIDSIKLATKLNTFLQNCQRTLKIFVQVKTSGEDTKSGVEQKDCQQLVQQILENCKQLEFSGLMTIGQQNDINAFQQMYQLRTEICSHFKLPIESIELSMGMSADYEQAIQEGSTNVRIGSTIFGHRDYSQKQEIKQESGNSENQQQQQIQQK